MSHDESNTIHRNVEYQKNRPMSVQASNPLIRSQDAPITTIKRRGNGRPQSAFGGGLGNSCYVRNPTALSVIQNEIDKGKSMIGSDPASPKNNQTSVQSLALLVSSEADFAAAFDSSVAIDNHLSNTRLNGSESGPAFFSKNGND